MHRADSVVGARSPNRGPEADSLTAPDRDLREVRVRGAEPAAMIDGDRQPASDRPRKRDNPGVHRRNGRSGNHRHIHTPMTAIAANRSKPTNHRTLWRDEPCAAGRRDQHRGKKGECSKHRLSPVLAPPHLHRTARVRHREGLCDRWELLLPGALALLRERQQKPIRATRSPTARPREANKSKPPLAAR